jgi:hypothetical protein
VKPHLALWVCAALTFSAGPALALKNVAGCDIVAFAGKDSPVVIPAERWQAYRVQSEMLLGQPQTAAATDWRGLGAHLVELQNTLLALVQGTKPYQDYLASDACRVLAKLDSGAIQTLLGEVGEVIPEQAAAALGRVTETARTQFDRIERTARFRSGQDKTLFAAGYYCFVAGAIAGLLPPERQQTIALDSFGTAVPCRDVGRTG